eukprot:467895_1
MSSISNAIELKNKGNTYLKENKFQQAINCYSQAISIDSTNYIFFANRALAYIKINQFKKALIDCKLSINLCNNYPKSYYRMTVVLNKLHKYIKAIAIARIAQQKWLKFYCVTNEQIEIEIQTAIKAINQSVSSPFIRLKTPLIQIYSHKSYHPNPLYYKDINNKPWFIIVPSTKSDSKIYKYDIINDTFDILCYYKNNMNITIQNHAICLDKMNKNTLKILCTDDRYSFNCGLQIISYDLMQCVWTDTKTTHDKTQLQFIPNRAFI